MIGIPFLILPFVILVILAVALFVLWLWMLIDCLKRPDNKFAIGGNNAKLIWTLVIIFTGFIGALLYYFFIKRKDYGGNGGTKMKFKNIAS